MARAVLTLTFKTKYLFCPTCSTSPLKLSQVEVEKFIKKHHKHSNNLYDRYTRLVGYVQQPKFLKGKKIVIKFINERKIKNEKQKVFKCHSKDCEYYNKGTKEFCSIKCKANHKDYKEQKRRKK